MELVELKVRRRILICGNELFLDLAAIEGFGLASTVSPEGWLTTIYLKNRRIEQFFVASVAELNSVVYEWATKVLETETWYAADTRFEREETPQCRE